MFPQIETFEQETVSMVIFMQDGAPPHCSCFVTDVLNERFPDAWIGRNGPIPWPPRSPDLSPLEFFLWGYIKNIVLSYSGFKSRPSFSITLYCTALYCTALHCTVLHCTALYCTVLYCTVLYCTALHCTALHCTV